MSGTQPVAVYAMKVPPGDILVPAVPDFAAMFRVSMAAIDPTAEPEYEDGEEKKKPRSTLKIVRVPGEMFDEDDSEEDDEDMDDLLDGLVGDDDDDDDDDDEDDDEEGDEVNGGPSDPRKTVKAKLRKMIEADIGAEDDEEQSEVSEDEAEARAALKKIMKGKGKAVHGEEDDDDEDEDDDDDENLEMEEVIVCTLDPEKNCQQTLDFVVGENERIFFKVTGTHSVHLTGNYVIPTDDVQARLFDEDDDEEEEYDLEPDEDELDALEDGDEEEDELDDLADPRVAKVDDDDDEEPAKAPKPSKDTGKGKNKRPAEDSLIAEDGSEDDVEANLDDIMAKSLKASEPAAAPATNEETKKLSKAEKKRLKKLKKNDGEAAAAPAQPTDTKSAVKNGTATEKKVQFAKDLEQGPSSSGNTPVKSDKKKPDTKPAKADSPRVREVQGVTIDDRKIGTGPAAKKGSKIEMRYIGKLEDGKQFDANKSGKPFAFKLGKGEVIKGWDIGVEGIQVGGERRLVIPAHLAYGKQGAPPSIPPNSKLTFDIKCLTIK